MDDTLNLLLELHANQDRQGPGNEACTELALRLCPLDTDQPLQVADLGCGTGASTKVLAQALRGQIQAIDFAQPFLNRLQMWSHKHPTEAEIVPVCADIASLSLTRESLDLIWSEGAIYNIGFQKGLVQWSEHLKPGGVMAISELTWRGADRPQELTQYWVNAYPEITTLAGNLEKIEQAHLSLVGFFWLPPEAWSAYYQPLEQQLGVFLAGHADDPIAQGIVAEEKVELGLYQRYAQHYSYGFYILQKPN